MVVCCCSLHSIAHMATKVFAIGLLRAPVILAGGCMEGEFKSLIQAWPVFISGEAALGSANGSL